MTRETDRTEANTHSKPGSASYPELNDALERHNLSLFVGADLPREVTGLPSRTDLAHELARRKGLDESLSLAEVAQHVARGGNRWDFTAFIRDRLDTTGKSPQPFHRRIVELVRDHEIETTITTAYDSLLELAFQETGIGISRVVRGSDVGFVNPERPTLIKLYGDAQQPDTLTVTEDDHYGLWRDRDKEDLLYEIRSVLRRQTVLFVGYHLADPDFNLLWREILDRAGRFARNAYAIWSGPSEANVQMWRDRGIIILDADPLGVLAELSAQPEPSALHTPPSSPPAPDTEQSGIGSSEGPEWKGSDRQHLIALREILSTRFSEDDLRTLCFDLDFVEYDDLPGQGRGNKARELVAFAERHDKVAQLVDAGQRLRPDVPWEGVLQDML